MVPKLLTEFFFFLSCKANARVQLADGARPALPIVMCAPSSVFCVPFVCKCVQYYCHRVSTQLQLNNNYNYYYYHYYYYYNNNNSKPPNKTQSTLSVVYANLFPTTMPYEFKSKTRSYLSCRTNVNHFLRTLLL
jgi:hypothetical protein